MSGRYTTAEASERERRRGPLRAIAEEIVPQATAGITSGTRWEPARYTGLVASPRGRAKTRGEEP
jgi:hypothetical protein